MSLYLGTSPVANTGYDKANTDLSNLSSQGKNIANWSNNVTNCITEIPQDIKLELNNGTLTLKAGSKLYVPNGAGVFDNVVINTDKVCTYGLAVTGLFMVIQVSNQHTFFVKPEYITSGTTAPTVGDNYRHIWYDTANNIIKMYAPNSSDYVQASFPIALCTSSGSDDKFSSIDQVFDGFGYIGSTVFALPGVKGLIPNGRNADGTLKNTEFTTSSVLTITMSGNWTDQLSINLKGSALYTTSTTKYYEDDNKVIDSNGYASDTAFIGSLYYNNGNISNFISKTAFHALDYSDSSTISGWSMPSSRYIDLTLGASGATYTAPANGYFYIAGTTTSSNGFYSIGGNIGMRVTQPSSSTGLNVFTPAKKGERVSVYYVGINTTAFRFVYAEGEN